MTITNAPTRQITTLVVAIADLKMIRIKIIFKRILEKHKTRFFLNELGHLTLDSTMFHSIGQ